MLQNCTTELNTNVARRYTKLAWHQQDQGMCDWVLNGGRVLQVGCTIMTYYDLL